MHCRENAGAGLPNLKNVVLARDERTWQHCHTRAHPSITARVFGFLAWEAKEATAVGLGLGYDDQVIGALGEVSPRRLELHPTIRRGVHEACDALVLRSVDTHKPSDPCFERDRNEEKLVLQGGKKPGEKQSYTRVFPDRDRE